MMECGGQNGITRADKKWDINLEIKNQMGKMDKYMETEII